MRGTWLLLRIRSAICGSSSSRTNGKLSDCSKRGFRPLHPTACHQIPAPYFDNDGIVWREYGASSSSRFPWPDRMAEHKSESGTTDREIFLRRIRACGFAHVPQITACPQFGESGFRAYSSAKDPDESRSRFTTIQKTSDDSEKIGINTKTSESPQAGNLVRVAGTSEGLPGALRELESPQGCVSIKSSVQSGIIMGAEIGRGACDYSEDWGGVPKHTVRKSDYVKMCKALKENSLGIFKLSQWGEANLRLLLALGANEKQVLVIWRKHPQLQMDTCAVTLLESARLFRDFSMDTRVLMQVLSAFNQLSRYNVFLWSAPDKARKILLYFQNELGVKEMGKVVTRIPFSLISSLQVIKERVDAVTSLGFVVDGAFVAKYGTLLTCKVTTLRKNAKNLEAALGPGAVQNNPFLLLVKAEKVLDRVANLSATIGNAKIVKHLLEKAPNLLISREETMKETWWNLVAMFGENEVEQRVISEPRILSLNWKTLHAKIEYLASKGFSKDYIIGSPARILLASLEKCIMPRIEQVTRDNGTYKGSLRLSTIICMPHAKFMKKFNVLP